MPNLPNNFSNATQSKLAVAPKPIQSMISCLKFIMICSLCQFILPNLLSAQTYNLHQHPSQQADEFKSIGSNKFNAPIEYQETYALAVKKTTEGKNKTWIQKSVGHQVTAEFNLDSYFGAYHNLQAFVVSTNNTLWVAGTYASNGKNFIASLRSDGVLLHKIDLESSFTFRQLKTNASNEVYAVGATTTNQDSKLICAKIAWDVSHTPYLSWQYEWLGSVNATAFDVCVDSRKNVYVVGWASQAGRNNNNNSKAQDGVLLKINDLGEMQWAQYTHGPDFEAIRGITKDEQDNIYICGWFWDSMQMGNYHLKSSGGCDAFVAKINPNGYTEWAKSLGGQNSSQTSNDACFAIAYHNQQIAVVGWFGYEMNLEGIQIQAFDQRDAFIALFSPNGNVDRAQNLSDFTTESEDGAFAIAPLSNGWLVAGEKTYTRQAENKSKNLNAYPASWWAFVVDPEEISVTDDTNIGQTLGQNILSAQPLISNINNNLNIDWQFYPNPAKEQIQVEIKSLPSNKEDYQITILLRNALGQEIRKIPFNLSQSSNSIPVDDLPRGIYIIQLVGIQLEQKQIIHSEKIVLE